MKVDYITYSNLIIDDIVFPDGRTSMNTLGGAGLHALIGMRVWSDALGYAATVGADLDQKHRDDLQAFGVDSTGLIVRENYDTARAWQVFEYNDYRHEIFRNSLDAFEQNKIQFADLPETYLRAKGYHIQWGTLDEFQRLISAIRGVNPAGKLIMEVNVNPEMEGPDKWRQILPLLDLFSPDEEESAAMTGETDPLKNCKTFIEWGAPLVAMRMGSAGSLLMESSGRCWQLPIIPTEIVDVTGAGNSYCGGCTVGLGEGLDPVEAALRGVVSASFSLEQLGVPSWGAELSAEANRRLEYARGEVKEI